MAYRVGTELQQSLYEPGVAPRACNVQWSSARAASAGEEWGIGLVHACGDAHSHCFGVVRRRRVRGYMKAVESLWCLDRFWWGLEVRERGSKVDGKECWREIHFRFLKNWSGGLLEPD